MEAIVFEDEHRLEPSVVHMYSCLYLFQRSLQYRSVHMEPECPYRCSLAPPGPAFVSWVGAWDEAINI